MTTFICTPAGSLESVMRERWRVFVSARTTECRIKYRPMCWCKFASTLSARNYSVRKKGEAERKHNDNTLSFNVSEIFYCCSHELTAKALHENLHEKQLIV